MIHLSLEAQKHLSAYCSFQPFRQNEEHGGVGAANFD
jgi:hypothetical protein